MPALTRRLASLDPIPWMVLAATLIGFFLRIAYLQYTTVWWDEIVTATRALLPLSELWTGLMYQTPSVITSDCSPPLHHGMIHFSLLLGHSNFFLKLPNILFGSLTIPMIYQLGKRLLDRRCGLFAAICLALSAFHFDYSRDARWYALFYFLNVSAFSFFLAALEEGRPRQWLGYAAATAGMLYTSYVAAPFIAAQVLAVGLLYARRETREPLRRRRVLRGLTLALLTAGLVFSPWLPGQLNAYYSFYLRGFPRPFVLWDFCVILTKFMALPLDRPTLLVPAVLAGALLGLFAFLRAKRYFSLLVLSLWTFVPVFFAYKAAIGFNISPKYVMGLLIFLVILAGAACSQLADLAETDRFGPTWRKTAPLAVGLLFTLVINLPNFAFPARWRPGKVNAREIMSYLARHQDGVPYLLFDNNRNFKAIADWELHGIYKGADALPAKGYARAWLLTYRKPGAALPPGTVFALDDMAAGRVGILHRAPLLLAPDASGTFTYSEDFSSLRIYTDAAAVENLAPDLRGRRLALYDPGRDGNLTYVFVNPTGGPLTGLRVNLLLRLERVAGLTPNAAFTVTAKSDQGEPVVLARLDASDFPAERGEFSRKLSLEVPSALLRGETLAIGLAIRHSLRQGEFTVSDLAFQARLADRPPVTMDVDRAYLDHIQADSPLTPYAPGAEPAWPMAPYVFAVNAQDAGGVVAGPEELARYRADHPEARPAYHLGDPSGRERFVFYDPRLDDPAVRLRPGRSVAITGTGDLRDVGGIKLSGKVVAPTLELGVKDLFLPLRTPPGTVTELNSRADGRMTLTAWYDQARFEAGQFYAYQGIRSLPGAEAVTCAAAEGPCFADYRLESHYPMQSLRVVWYPKCFGARGKATFARLSLSLDGGPWRQLDELAGDGEKTWRGSEPRVVNLDLDRPASVALLRLELSGDAAQVDSPEGYPFLFEARLDARALPSVTLGSVASPLDITGDLANDFGLSLAPEPYVFHSFLDRRY